MNESPILRKEQYLYTEIQEGNSPSGLTPLQMKIAPHVERIEVLLWVIWIITLFVVLHKLFILSLKNSNS